MHRLINKKLVGRGKGAFLETDWGVGHIISRVDVSEYRSLRKFHSGDCRPTTTRHPRTSPLPAHAHVRVELTKSSAPPASGNKCQTACGWTRIVVVDGSRWRLCSPDAHVGGGGRRRCWRVGSRRRTTVASVATGFTVQYVLYSFAQRGIPLKLPPNYGRMCDMISILIYFSILFSFSVLSYVKYLVEL